MVLYLKGQLILKGRMKFGVEIPDTVEEEVHLEESNSNSLWKDSIYKEMKNSHIAFKMF